MERKPISYAFKIAVVLSFMLSLLTGQAFAASSLSDSKLPARTAQEIKAQWTKLMNPSADFNIPFVRQPTVASPYTPGILKPQYILDGVNAVNFYRFISGLPHDVISTSSLNAQAQYGSVLMAAEDNFSHTPPKPADMPQSFFAKGLASTSSANIYASSGFDDHIVAHSVGAYMEDSDTGNLPVLGHRRWILNPPLLKVGFGLADSEDDWSYSAMQVFDKSRPKTVDYDYVAYPAAGAFPVEIFDSYYAWSISLNMIKFKLPVESGIKVYVKRLSDKKTWMLSSKNGKVSEKGAYFNLETHGYGSGTAIIFRPDGIAKFKAGDRYTVTVTGLKTLKGTSRPLTYTVNFMSVT
ncbi:CAP domain-containing protein [Cohnella lupini]|uniref:Uncharacterized protein YkwD n=1 Tax=Cohnella lupini TaxID=1294267 RepID=A0A3D9ISW5_9BACL|nr:CAP domain-containing protein [Cohnella lupini]RED64737.1 uncharacterized protein YkwD [Cohnella lupini]